MLEKIYEFDITQEEFMVMYEKNEDRTLIVGDFISLISTIKKSLFLEEKQDALNKLERATNDYYKKYGTGITEIIKDRFYINGLKNEISEHKQSSLEKLLEKQTLIEAMPYQEKIDKIRRKKNDREGGGNIKDFLQWLDVRGAEVDF